MCKVMARLALLTLVFAVPVLTSGCATGAVSGVSELLKPVIEALSGIATDATGGATSTNGASGATSPNGASSMSGAGIDSAISTLTGSLSGQGAGQLQGPSDQLSQMTGALGNAAQGVSGLTGALTSPLTLVDKLF